MSYVGISGVVNPAQERIYWQIYKDLKLDNDRELMIGVKATEKPQWLNMPNKYGEGWYLVGDNIEDAHDPIYRDIVPCLQVFLGSLEGTTDAFSFIDKLNIRTKNWGPRTFQFDMFHWMNPGVEHLLEHVRKIRGLGGQTILQAFGEYMKEYRPDELALKFRRLVTNGLVDYILFDASHGTGATLDVNALGPFVDTAYQVLQDSSGVAIAGGLDGPTIRDHLPQLLAEFPDLSWDAEGKLHHKDGTNSGLLKHKEVKDYLSASAEVIKAVQIN